MRKWTQWCDIGTSFWQVKLRRGSVVVDRAWIYVALDTQGNCLRSSWNSDETYNDSSNFDWSRKYICICSNTSENMVDYKHLCIAKQRPSSLMSSSKLWQSPLHPHTSNTIERPYNIHLQWNKALALVWTTWCYHILYCTILWLYHIAKCSKF